MGRRITVKFVLYFAIGWCVLLAAACAFDNEIRVYIDNPAIEEINVFKSCEGITVTSKEEAADYIVTTKDTVGENKYIVWTELFIATADGDFIFSKRNSDLYDLILDACEAIRSQ